MITPADSLGPLAIVRSTLLRRCPSVETMRLFEPSLSKNTPFRRIVRWPRTHDADGDKAGVGEFVARRRPNESGHQLADEKLDVASEGVARGELGWSFEAEVEQADVGGVGEQRASPGLAPRLAERHVA